MNSPAPLETALEESTRSVRWRILEWLLVFVSFAIFASVRSPIPGVNEPHYLTKARHFWNPTWCSRDPFLQSANAHYVFYSTVGALTQFESLENTALVGRVLGWLLLATGWCQLARRLIPQGWPGLWSAWLFLLLAAIGNWSGEWVVGGVEAKVFSYGCAWWSLAAALAGQPVRAAAWCGAAISFHPVVGVWNAIALIGATFIDDFRPWKWRCRYSLQSVVMAAVTGLICSAPGLIPAIAMLRGADRLQSYQADYIQVFYRLSHHLDPWNFSIYGDVGYAGLLVVSGILFALLRRPAVSLPRWNLACRYVVAAGLIAVGGLTIRALPEIAQWLLRSNVMPGATDWLTGWVNYRPHLAGWLKFYPFRLADVAIPWGTTLLITAVSLQWMTARSRNFEDAKLPAASIGKWGPWLVCGSCFVAAVTLPAIDRHPSRLSPPQFASWVDACRWVQSSTPQDALCYATHEGWALRWYASRAEYLSHKDCPQDAPGIIAWNERFKLVTRWSNENLATGFSKSAIREFRRQTGIDYVIANKFGPFDLEPVYSNGVYHVYRLEDAD